FFCHPAFVIVEFCIQTKILVIGCCQFCGVLLLGCWSFRSGVNFLFSLSRYVLRLCLRCSRLILFHYIVILIFLFLVFCHKLSYCLVNLGNAVAISLPLAKDRQPVSFYSSQAY